MMNMASRNWLKLLIPIAFSVSILAVENRDLGSLQEWCTLRNESINCHVSSANPMDFEVIRDWTRRQNEENVSMDISCDEGGSIKLPWPMKAKHLTHLNVSNCRLLDYHKESFKKSLDNETDYLRELYLINCEIEASVADTFERILNVGNLSRSYHCGSQVSRVVVIQNTTVSLVQDENQKFNEYELINDIYENVENMNSIIDYKCQYDDLELLDDSVCNSRGKLYFEQKTLASYPKLKVYNISKNVLDKFPKEIVHWSTYFPALEVLDLSGNLFRKFDFAPYKYGDRAEPLLVDMKNNRVERFPPGSIVMLYRKPAILVDLRGNPIICDCGVTEYQEYLRGIRDVYPGYEYLLDVECDLPVDLKKQQVLSFNSTQC